MNNFYVVGRLVRDPEIKETENGKKYTNITLAVPRSYKNAEGIYESDFIDCVLWQGVAERVDEYCQKGDLLGVRGRLETDIYEKDGKSVKSTQVIADKISFLRSKSNDKVEDKKDEKSKAKKKSQDREK